MLAEISTGEIPSPFLGHDLEPWRTLQLWLESFTANVSQKNLIPERSLCQTDPVWFSWIHIYFLIFFYAIYVSSFINTIPLTNL